MPSNRWTALWAMPFAMALLAGCGAVGEGSNAGPVTGRAAVVGSGYTSDQLEQALLTELPGFRRVGEPESGEYGALPPVHRLDRTQRQVKLGDARCARARPDAGLDRAMPAAITTFAKSNGVALTETLLAMPDDQSERKVRERVPDGCQRFRTTIGTQTADHRVVEPPPGTLGLGSRTVGVSTTSAGTHTKTWYVVVRGRRHLVTVTLHGAVATRADAEDIARRAHEQARRILP